MLIPCIDLQDGRAVQLVHGRERKLAVDDVFGLLDRFGAHPLIHVIDLDAAMRKGSNARLVRELCASARKRKMRVRVGGGIRTVAQAAKLVDCGAEKIIVGSAAFKDARVNTTFLANLVRRIGRKRIIVALDTEGGRILVRGWQEKLRLRPEDVIPTLEKYTSGFLCTCTWMRRVRCAARIFSLVPENCAARRSARSQLPEGFISAAKFARSPGSIWTPRSAWRCTRENCPDVRK